MADTKYTFLPWVRQGFGSLLTGTESVDSVGRLKQKFEMPVTRQSSPIFTVSQEMTLLGPGDIVGIDKKNIVRMQPEPNTPNFEPNYLPFIEFYQDSFCWDYTPQGPYGTNKNKLNPWVILVVVPDDPDQISFKEGADGLPPIISGAGLSQYFPKHDQVWAWAHLHVYGDVSTEAALATNDPDFAVCRLVCPIRLAPDKRYRACVVPVFENGRIAGLGRTTFLATDRVAWNSPQFPNEFPVYHTWTFQTGANGDFESLVRLLEARQMDPTIGHQPMDVSLSVMKVPAASNQSPPELLLGGALRLPVSTPEDWTESDRDNWKTKIADLLNLNEAAVYPDVSNAPGPEPIVTPPIYGRNHALTNKVIGSFVTPDQPLPDQNAVVDPIWLHELNLDPRMRAAAGLGVRVVQDDQDHFLEMAWEQVGAILEANQILKQGQFTIEVVSRMWQRHVETLDAGEQMSLLGPLLPKVVNDCQTCGSQYPGVTVWQAWQNAGLPSGVLDTSVRMIRRPRGRIVKKLRPIINHPGVNAGSFINNFTIKTAIDKPTVALPGRPFPKADGHNTLPTTTQSKPQCPPMTLPDIIKQWKSGKANNCTPSPVVSIDGATVFEISANLDQLALFFEMFQPLPPQPQPVIKPFLISNEICCLKIKAHPQQSIKIKILSQIGGADLDAIVPVMAYPDFPQPMYEKLLKISQDFILPNVSKIPQNTLALLVANQPFIESFMVGLNDEMARELLWNEYPTDQRGSYFRRFWDRRGRVGPAPTTEQGKIDLEESLRDITPIHRWKKWDFLGDHKPTPMNAPPVDSEQLVLLIRGELLQRYPNTLIYAVRVNKTGGKYEFSTPTSTRHPQYSAKMPSDITLLGFDLSVQDILDSAQPNSNYGWFFVIRETPAGPRLGMDEINPSSPVTSAPATPNDLNWAHIGITANNVINLDNTAFMNSHTWKAHSASLANWLYQRPVTVAVSAVELLVKAGYQ